MLCPLPLIALQAAALAEIGLSSGTQSPLSSPSSPQASPILCVTCEAPCVLTSWMCRAACRSCVVQQPWTPDLPQQLMVECADKSQVGPFAGSYARLLCLLSCMRFLSLLLFPAMHAGCQHD
jgi:hypothetical protein